MENKGGHRKIAVFAVRHPNIVYLLVDTLKKCNATLLPGGTLECCVDHQHGLNLNALCKPSEVAYTLIPTMFYFEFLLINSGNNVATPEPDHCDLVDVKLGHEYELIVTTYSGLYRYCVGDVLRVARFKNAAPMFTFDGLLGLGGAPELLMSETSSQFGEPFSYCLSPTSGGAGFLALGEPNSSNTAAGFSVGGAPLAIPPSAFSSGMVIDSGTVITGLLVTAYAAVTAASDAAATSDLLRDLTPESYVNDGALRQKVEDDHGIGLLGGDDDLPSFDRLWKYCCGYAGVSLAAARALIDDASEITINWSGGMHHASACKASGFCYINDTLIAINELLSYPCRPVAIAPPPSSPRARCHRASPRHAPGCRRASSLSVVNPSDAPPPPPSRGRAVLAQAGRARRASARLSEEEEGEKKEKKAGVFWYLHNSFSLHFDWK
uniref:Uncharacterized protein n=1 Tax=Oryza meridionalis TaxID=40149 RepID=A0A0E0C068_9ORYZ